MQKRQLSFAKQAAMSTTTIHDRFKNLIEALRLNTNQLAKELGYERATKLYNIVNKAGNPSYDILKDLATRFPVINIRWLLTGEGEMFLNQPGDIKTLKPQPADKGIPYYDIDATAGDVAVFEEDHEVVNRHFVIPNFNDCDFAINVSGHSMYPKINNGDIILCKRLHDLEVVPLGEIYLIITDEQRLIKYIRKADTRDHYLLVSENPKFDPFEIHRSKIRQLYLVKGRIEKNQI